MGKLQKWSTCDKTVSAVNSPGMPHIAFALLENFYWVPSLPGAWRGQTACPLSGFFGIISPKTSLSLIDWIGSASEHAADAPRHWRRLTSGSQQSTDHNCLIFRKLNPADIPFFCTEKIKTETVTGSARLFNAFAINNLCLKIFRIRLLFGNCVWVVKYLDLTSFSWHKGRGGALTCNCYESAPVSPGCLPLWVRISRNTDRTPPGHFYIIVKSVCVTADWHPIGGGVGVGIPTALRSSEVSCWCWSRHNERAPPRTACTLMLAGVSWEDAIL